MVSIIKVEIDVNWSVNLSGARTISTYILPVEKVQKIIICNWISEMTDVSHNPFRRISFRHKLICRRNIRFSIELSKYLYHHNTIKLLETLKLSELGLVTVRHSFHPEHNAFQVSNLRTFTNSPQSTNYSI